MFRDEAVVEVTAGKGGDGAVSFRTEKYVPKGGPDGGDGGRGGDVIFVASSRVTSLISVARSPRYRAKNGKPGGPRLCTGESGKPVRVEVPIGTLIYDSERGNRLADLTEEGQELVVAEGGKHGKGNNRFKNSVRQEPRYATKGAEGERRELRLELKLFADVGLVGLPNAGKSTFLSVVTKARPKVADYPFTTLDPQVGIASVSDYQTLVIADLPGLVEGAAQGVGLGHRFLRHVERCRVLLHLVDCSPEGVDDPFESFNSITKELEEFSPLLAGKTLVLAASKVEGPQAEEVAAALEEATGHPVLRFSSHTHQGLPELLTRLHQLVTDSRERGE